MKNTINKIKMGIIIVISVIISACGNITEPEINSDLVNISKLDGKSIISLNESDFYENEFLEVYRDNIAERFGLEIISSVNAKTQRNKQNGEPGGEVVLIKDLQIPKAKIADELSSHLKVLEVDGSSEEFILGVRRYVQNASSTKEKSNGSNVLTDDKAWLALSPDRFYVQDDKQGNENWPVTFEAVNLANAREKINVTFDKNGFVSSTLEDKTTVPNLLFVEAVPVILDVTDPCEENPDGCSGGGGGGGSGGGSSRINDWTRGESTGSYCTPCTHFVVKAVQLSVSGDGDAAAELQMFVKNNDNYNYNYPVSYKYRFDRVFRSDPVYGSYSQNTLISGSDGGYPYYTYYEVPDISYAGSNYSFQNTRYYISHNGSDYNTTLPTYSDYFPLINLTQRPGNWRVTLVEDDKDYPDFARVDVSSFAKYIWTYYMNDGVWRQILTGFTVRSKSSGNSDDALEHTGVRRITESNVRSRLGSFSSFFAQKSYSNSQLQKYTFGLETYY